MMIEQPPTPDEIVTAFKAALVQTNGGVDLEKLLKSTSSYLDKEEQELLQLQLEEEARLFFLAKAIDQSTER